MSRFSLVRLVGSVFIAALVACAPPTPDPTADLEELPAELAAELVVAQSAPMLVTRAGDTEIPEPTEPETPAAPGQLQFCQEYKGVVTYPVTLCLPSSEFVNEVVAQSGSQEGVTANVGLVPAPEPARFFKLTRFQGRGLSRPFFCTARSGPWFVQLREELSCDPPEPPTYSLVIAGIPNPLLFTWTGSLENPPAGLANLHVDPISETPIACGCCDPSETFCEGFGCVSSQFEDPCEQTPQ